VAKRHTVCGIQTLILKPESEILASQGQEAHFHHIKTVATVSLAALIIQDPFFFIPPGFLGSFGFDVDIFVPSLKMPAWITETVVSFSIPGWPQLAPEFEKLRRNHGKSQVRLFSQTQFSEV
jgi:hypothetical protein